MRRRKLIGAIFAYAALLALLVLFLFPLLWILGLSFKTRMQVFAAPPLGLRLRLLHRIEYGIEEVQRKHHQHARQRIGALELPGHAVGVGGDVVIASLRPDAIRLDVLAAFAGGKIVLYLSS